MKICRFNETRLGVVLDEEVRDVTAALEALPPRVWPQPPGDPLIAHWDLLAPRIAGLLDAAPRHPLGAVTLHAPLTQPSKIIGIARNRRGLAQETIDLGGSSGATRQDGDPIQMFIKATSAIAGSAEGVRLRFPERRTDPEAELTVVIGRPASRVTAAQALDHVFGYCIGLDMTLRGKESPSSRKSMDTYAGLGPWLVTRDEIADPDNLATQFALNGRIIQSANTRDLAFDIRQIVAHASTFFTLHPGDAIMVGTPVGFEPVKPGDVMVAQFEGIGRMEVRVTAED